MGAKIDNQPNYRNSYWGPDGTYNPNGNNDVANLSAVDAGGALNQAAGGKNAPPDSPELTDQLIRQKRASEMTRLMLGMGRRSTFSAADLGSLNLGTKSLTGGS